MFYWLSLNMEIIEISILDPKVKKILADLADLDLIELGKVHKLNSEQRRKISIGRSQIKNGKIKDHKSVISGLEKWLKEK
jgi:hypothetical protein